MVVHTTITMTFSKDLFYLTGALRDGSVFYDKASRNYTLVWYSNSASYLDESIVCRVVKVFGKKPKVYEYRSGNYRVRISSKDAYLQLKRIFDFPDEGIGQINWGVSQTLRNATYGLRIAYIRAMYDAEGDVSIRNRYIEVSQKNTEVLEWIRTVLNDYGINSGSVVLADKKSMTYKFVISEKRSVWLFRKQIGFELDSKKKMLDLLCLR